MAAKAAGTDWWSMERAMRNYIVRRLVVVPFMLFAMSLLLFLLLFIRPGNAAIASVGGIQSQKDVAVFAHQLGLDRPWYVQYFDWLGHAVRGDFGRALIPPHNSVSQQIGRRIGNTIEIGLLTILISAIVGIPIGVMAAVRRNSWADYLLRTITIAGISVPNFWTATLLLILPARWWGWTPLSKHYVTFTDDPLRNLSIVIWPALILAYASSAYTARFVRSSMLEVFYSDYIRTARAKGLRERSVVWRHAFRNSLIVLVTVVGLQLGVILGGSVIAEQIFAIPGIGFLTYQAILLDDYTVVLATVMIISSMFIVVNLLVDMLYTVIDPRIRY
jgi:peptide/nickel transport system permease protein